MKLTSWLPYVTSRIITPLATDRKPRRGRRYARSVSELLESRTLLAAVMWDGGGGNLDWNNATNWSTDQLPGAGDDVTIDAPGEVTIEVSSDVAIHSLQTSDALTVSSGIFSISGDSQINAQFTNAGGTVSISGVTVTGVGPLVNGVWSTLAVSASTINMAVENNGTLVVRGDVHLNGALTTGVGSAIEIRERYNLNASLTVASGFTNHGLIDLTEQANTNTAQYVSWLDVTSGTLLNAVDGTIRSSGYDGYRRLYGAVDNQGLVQVDYPLYWEQTGTQSTNSGTIRLAGGDLTIQGGGLTNTATGIIDIQSDGIFGGPGCPELINQGLFVKSGADGVTDLRMHLYNSGTVEVQRGILNVGCGYVQTAGRTVVTGGNLTGTVEIQGGAVQGNVAADYTVSGELNVSPSLAPVVPANTYTQTSTGVLHEQIAGHTGVGVYGTPGTDYGQLVVNGDVALNGTLQVQVLSPFVPSIGQQFLVIDNRGTSPIGGTFIGLLQDEIVWAGIYGFSVSYAGGDGNDFVLTMDRVANTPPIADAGGPCEVLEGGSVTLSASASSDAQQANTSLVFAWDLDGDEVFGESGAAAGRGNENVMEPVFSAVGLDGPSTYTVSVRVTDSYGQSDVDDVAIGITNAAPTAPVDNNTAANEVLENSPFGTLVGITAVSTDPGVLDTVSYSLTDDAGGRFAIDSGTGVVNVAISSLLDYEAATSHSITVEASDGQGGKSTQTFTINLLNVTATISGTVFVDADGDGLFDGGTETAIDAVMIELYHSAGGLLDTDLTALGGVYAFTVNDEKATYRLREIQPTGVNNGAAILGSAGGDVLSSNEMRLTLNGSNASDYDFTESGQAVQAGDTASIGFWQNKNGQALIKQGGAALVTWLNANFGNIFGNTFSNGSGGDNAIEVASFYKNEFFNQKLKGTPKVDAQFMATALATFFTSSNLSGGNVAASYGFNVTQTGLGTKVVNIGSSGAAFGVANNTNMTIMSLLLATNNLTGANANGYSNVYDTNGDGVLDDNEKALRVLANTIYSAINEGGHI